MDRGPFRAQRPSRRPPDRSEPARTPSPQPKEEPAVVREAPKPDPAPPAVERQLPKPERIETTAPTNTARRQGSQREEQHVKAYGHYNLIKRWALPGVSVIAVVAIVVVIILGVKLAHGGASGINNNEYQAVFLQNGQDYFGKLSVLNGGYFKLTDVYYLQSSSGSASTSTSSSDNTTLVKLGSEIHAPEDEMIIAKDQVLFYENIKSSGKVAQAIAQYQKQHN